MIDTEETLPVRLAIAISDAARAQRIAAALADVEGVRLAEAGTPADAEIVVPQARRQSEALDQPLTQREHDVLALMAEGATNKEIARRLGISVNTAKFHIRSLMDKLDAVSRTDAVVHASRIGVIEI